MCPGRIDISAASSTSKGSDTPTCYIDYTPHESCKDLKKKKKMKLLGFH